MKTFNAKLMLPLVASLVLGVGLSTQASAEDCANAYDASHTYTQGDVVSVDGFNWTAAHWTKNQTPGTGGEWGPWRNAIACGEGAVVDVSESASFLFDSSKTYLKSIGGTTYEVSELTVCDADEFQTVAPTLTSDRTCSPHSKPAPHQRIKTAGTALADAVIENTCSDSEWYDNGNCKAPTVCDARQVQTQDPTVTSDRVCSDLPPDVVIYTYKFDPKPGYENRYVDQLVGSDGTKVQCVRDSHREWRSVCNTEDVSGRISITGIPGYDIRTLVLSGGNISSIVHNDWRFPGHIDESRIWGGIYGLGVVLLGHKNFDDACPMGLTRTTNAAKNPNTRFRISRDWNQSTDNEYQCLQ